MSLIRKSGTLPILCYLYRKKEARFHDLVDELGVPQKTAAVRLAELLRVRLIERQVRQDGENGRGFHIYALSDGGMKLAREIGPSLVSRLVNAERELAKVEKKISTKMEG
jgi:predicted ArsR family transcriptional regulator